MEALTLTAHWMNALKPWAGNMAFYGQTVNGLQGHKKAFIGLKVL